jgi:alkylhydroperoxidase family enzyme
MRKAIVKISLIDIPDRPRADGMNAEKILELEMSGEVIDVRNRVTALLSMYRPAEDNETRESS